MKRNLISILILALLIVNIVLTGIMMFSMTGAANKTSALVNKIAMVLNLELEIEGGEEIIEVAVEDSLPFPLAEEMTIPLKKDESGDPHFVMVKAATFYMDITHEDYKELSESLTIQEPAIRAAIQGVYNSYTIEEVEADLTALELEVLEEVQAIFQSDFIYKANLETITQ